MRHLFALCLILCAVSAQPGLAQNRFNADAKSCDLNDKTKLTALCPSGFGQPDWSGGMDGFIARQPNTASMIVDSANANGIDPQLALAVSGAEAGLSACAGSFSGVQGPMQLTQRTGRGFGMNRGILTENINGGMLTLKAAIKSCGGDTDTRCLADRYNGSTEQERQNWTKKVNNYRAQLASKTATTPSGCSGQAQCIQGPGDFPTSRTPVAGVPPPPSPTDVQVGVGQV